MQLLNPISIENWNKTLQAFGLDVTIERNSRETIAPSTSEGDVLTRDAMHDLARRSISERYSEGELLGEGGMGIVRLGLQHSLVRPVALKSVKEGQLTDQARLKLLREAWITGRLEHPNIVPVHDLGIDDRGEPRIILKRIEGSSWESLFGDAEAVRTRFGENDLLEWNLRVLMEVARAAHFAHGRGIVHRDLKPENVMIGGAGEVYVVDWGLAVALEDDGTGRLPLACNARELAGTPAYMAPEQWGGSPDIGVRTDTYLLGATLFEVLVGRPPRVGKNLAQLAAASFLDPEIPESVPHELATLLRCALAPRIEARPESAEAFRREVATYLRHRGSIELSHDAMERTSELERLLASPHDRVAVYQMFGAARFGFLEALRAWPDNVSAKQGLARVVKTMIEAELQDGDALGAQALIPDLGGAFPELEAHVHAAVDKHRLDQEALKNRARDLDPSIGRRTRWFVSTIGATTGIIGTVGRWWWMEHTGSSLTHADNLRNALLILAGCIAIAFWARESLLRTAVNRGLIGAAVVAVAGQVLLSVGGALADIPAELTSVQFLALWAGVAACAGISIEPRLLGMASVFALAYLVSSVHPDWRLPATALSQGVLLGTVSWLWWHPKEDIQYALQERAKAFAKQAEKRAKKDGVENGP